MSVAIIPMAHDYGWSPTVSGLIQSSFFYGYALCQLPGIYTQFAKSHIYYQVDIFHPNFLGHACYQLALVSGP